MRRILVAVLGAALCATTPVMTTAQGTSHTHSDHGAHAGHATPAAKDGTGSEAVKAFQAANDKMHKDMAIAFTGNADVDFVKGMIPHHQGAIDMAKVVLAHGKDPAILNLARDVIRAQEAEIKMMQEWLKANDVKK